VVVQGISAATDADPSTIEDVPGAIIDFTVPRTRPSSRSCVWARGDNCNFGAAGVPCILYVAVDTNTRGPFWMAVDDTGDNFQEGHAVQTVSPTLGPGSHTIKLRFNTGGASTTFGLNTGVMTAELWRVT